MISRRYLIVIVAAVLILGAVKISVSQNLDLRHYRVQDGLVSEHLTTVIQTDDGYMWFGTAGQGIFRFDGINSKQYSSPQGLAGDTVEVLFQDSQKRIWAATATGGLALVKEDSVSYPFLYHDINYSRISRIEESSDSTIWIGTSESGLFTLKNGELSHISTRNSELIDDTINDIWIEGNEKVWIATPEGIALYEDGMFTNYRSAFKEVTPEKLYHHRQHLWVGTREGLHRWDGGAILQEITTGGGQSLGPVTDIIQNRKGNLVVGTTNRGVVQFDDETITVFDTTNGLPNNTVVDLYLNFEKKIWAITENSGACLFRNEAFRKYSLQTNILAAKHGPNDAVWFATDQGLRFWDAEKKSLIEPGYAPADMEFTDIAAYPGGDLLLLSAGRELIRFDGHRFTSIPQGDKLRNNSSRVFEIFVTTKGEILAGTDSGLFYFREKGLRRFDTKNGLPHQNVWHIMEDRVGRFWISTSRGLRILDEGKLEEVGALKQLGKDKFYRYTLQDENGDYWLGTNEGIIYFHPGSDTTEARTRLIDNNDGLLSVDTQFLLNDGRGFLWHGTKAGLHKINLDRFHSGMEFPVVHFSLANQGMGIAFNHGSVSRYSDAKLWFGSSRGAVLYDAYSNNIRNLGPFIHITDVELSFDEEQSGKKYYTSVLTDPDQGKLKYFSHYENNFTFDFVALDFDSPEKVLYQYMLEGIDPNWSSLNQLKRVSYSNLAPGKYTFKVKAKDSHGVWSATTATYSFVINPPFWQSAWFYGLVLVAVAGVLYGGSRIWLHSYEKKKLNELVDQQTRELQKGLREKEILLAEVHHRVKNNLAVISGLVELQKGVVEGPKAVRAMTETQNRVKSIAMIHEKLYQSEMFTDVSLRKYIEELVDVIADSYNVNNKRIKTEVQAEDVRVTLDQSIPCGLILNELLCNAYEHAFKEQKQGNIWIFLKEEAGSIYLDVADDGIGLPADFDIASSGSLGMRLIHVLTKQLDGELEIKNRVGSMFKIQFKKDIEGKGPINNNNDVIS